MTNSLEEMARKVIIRWDGTFGREGIGTLLMAGQIKNLEILIEDALKTLRSKTRKEDAEKLRIAMDALGRIENHFYFDKSKADSKDLDYCVELAKQARKAIL